MESIFIHLADDSASTLHRCTQPLKFCRAALAADGVKMVAKPGLTEEDLYSHDCYIFRSVLNSQFWPVIDQLKRRAVVVLSVDDDLANIPEWNPASDRMAGDSAKAVFKTTLQMADKLLVSTHKLAEALGHSYKTVVAPNLINLDDYKTFWKAESKQHVVGWAGSGVHWGDLRLIEHLPEKHPDMHFRFFGDLPHGLTKYYIRPGRQTVEKHTIGDNVSLTPWMGHQNYIDEIKTSPINVGLAPLADCPFNHSKSALKYLEYSAMGITTIAQNMSPYSDVITHGVNGYLVDDWENVDLRPEDLGKAAFDHVAANHSWQSEEAWQLWINAFMQLLF